MLRFPLFAHAPARGTDKHKMFRDEFASIMSISSHVAALKFSFVHASITICARACGQRARSCTKVNMSAYSKTTCMW